MNIVVVGQGYVGLPLAMRAVEVGHSVVGYELDDERVRRLNAGDSYVEDIPDAQLARRHRHRPLPGVRRRGRVQGLRRRRHHRPHAAARGRARPVLHRERRGHPGARTCAPAPPWCSSRPPTPAPPRSWPRPILEQGSGLVAGRDFHLGYSPERIDPGNATWTFLNTPKVVSGIDAASLAAVQGFYDSLVERTVPVANCRIAELTKLLENTFRHVNIALVNELAIYAADLDIDVWEAVQAAVEQAVRVHALLPRARRRRALPAGRPQLPVVARRALARAPVPLRGAGQRRQRAHARLRGPAVRCSP